MTYAQFVKDLQRQQSKYIAEEERRMKKAAALWYKFKADMNKLGLHPLNGTELADRRRELIRMRADIPETHGDSAVMQWSYETRKEPVA